MAPIRIGLIGLSTNEDSLTSWAANAHLPYLKQSSKYAIVALCNTSVEKAKASIEKFGLSSSTKTYGSPEEMAKDKDIDLAVCVTNVTTHYEILLPFIEAGMNCFTELPLAQDITKMRKLASLAKEKGIRTCIGMQALPNPVVNVLKKTIAEGKIGKVLTSTFVGYGGVYNGTPRAEKFAQLFKRSNGANMLTIWLLHCKSERPSSSMLDLR